MLKKLNHFKIYFFLCFISLVFLSLPLSKIKEIDFNGKSMGTKYKIKILSDKHSHHKHVKTVTNKYLSKLDKSLSAYNKISEINYFNSILNSHFSPSNKFITILSISKILCNLSEGLWDPSINSINNIWELNQKQLMNKKHYLFNLSYLLDKIGFREGIAVKKNGYLNKKKVNTFLDFSSIAKGFGVDQIASFFNKKGFKNFLIEIGGEIYLTKKNNVNKKWAIGIYHPKKKYNSNNILNSIYLKNKAIATSGNYNNYVKYSKIKLPHIINPITGNPISNLISSVSVIANNCTIADALATILMLITPKDSIYLINSLENIECIITVINDDGSIKNYLSNGLL